MRVEEQGGVWQLVTNTGRRFVLTPAKDAGDGDDGRCKEERHALLDQIMIASTTPELRILARAAIEAYEAHRMNAPPGPWSEAKNRLLEAAYAFAKVST